MTDSHHASLSIYGNPTTNHGPMLTLLAGWFAFIFTVAVAGIFERPPGSPPSSTIIAVAIPILGFFFLYATQERFRHYVLNLDLRVLTIVHAWRMVGFAFVLLHIRDALPGLFAWPASLGDISGAITAPAILFALLKSPGLATSSRFISWHVFGLVDFIAAIGTGILSSGAVAEMPLVLIPAFFVPFLAISHFAAILKALKLRQDRLDVVWDGVPGSA
jgi:hypothetical protein